MKRWFYATLAVAIPMVTALTTHANASDKTVQLMEAIETSAKNIAEKLTEKSRRVAVVAFESENDKLSDYIMEEITGALVNLGVEVADRQNLEYVFKELELQNLSKTSEVKDKDAQAIGKFVAAELIITGQLIDIGGSYRYRANAVGCMVSKATMTVLWRTSTKR
jgi:5-hydroxyisourate hydrolase-like protein (transthyretin family)